MNTKNLKSYIVGNWILMWMIHPAIFYPDKNGVVLTATEQRCMTHGDDQIDETCRLYTDMIHYLIVEAEKGQNGSDGHLSTLYGSAPIASKKPLSMRSTWTQMWRPPCRNGSIEEENPCHMLSSML